MSPLPTMPVGVDRHIADTAHMSNEEAGAYFRLQIFAWRSPGCCLPDDDARLARMLGTTQKRWVKIKPTVMASWTLNDGTWTNEQVAREHQFVSEKVEKKRSAGKQGGRPKSLPDNDPGKASGFETEKQNESEPKAAKAKAKYTPKVPKGTEPDGFTEFWSAYPRRDGDNPRKTALRAYVAAIRRGATRETIIAGLRGYAADLDGKGKIGTEFVATAAAWLNQERFNRSVPAKALDGQAPDPAAYLARLTDDDWRGHVRSWRATGGQWLLAQRTPAPDHPQTKVPPRILAEFEIGAGRAQMEAAE